MRSDDVAYKTPGVYIVEKDAFPNSVVEVATAVPAFIGHTEKADNKGTPLAGKAWRITSLSEYIEYFGGPPDARFNVAAIDDAKNIGEGDLLIADGANPAGPKKAYRLTQDSGAYLLYYSMQLFFQNGGGPCYVVSVGSYADAIDAEKLKGGLEILRKEQEPTMVVIPEAMLFKGTGDTPEAIAAAGAAVAIDVQQAMLQHCGEVMKNRFAILDIHGGYRDRRDPAGDPVGAFRSALGVNHLAFAAAYYPWVDTTIVAESAVSFVNLTNEAKALVKTLLTADMKLDAPPPTDKIALKSFQEKVDAVAKVDSPWALDDQDLKTPDDVARAQLMLHQLLAKFSPVYARLMSGIAKQLNRLPPAAAMAGLYTSVDNSRGVWKAPANVSLNAVIAPTVSVSHADQEDLNVTTSGKSINAIRAFIGSGVLVWGARTLDGNSLDWRYVNVRRTMIMLEESLRLAMAAYVFEPNTANTWVTVKGMAANFLTGIWKRGGLAGATPEDAFSVFCGLGETMTGDDILEGRMNMTVLVALSRPAEFIEITFQQQMQKS
jgi:phage tail sheath protein FI